MCAGGMGALALAIFHKLETSQKLKVVRECGTCCNLLKRDPAQVGLTGGGGRERRVGGMRN